MQVIIASFFNSDILLVLACIVLLFFAVFALFRDRAVRYIGHLTIIIFITTLLPTLGVIEFLDIELPHWLTGRRSLRSIILLLWIWCSYKAANRIYYRKLN